MEAVAARRITTAVAVPQPRITIAGLKHALGNCLLAISFLLATWPAAHKLTFDLAGAANIVWLAGAAIMGVMCFARFVPRSATVNPSTLLASGAMLLLPCLMRPANPSVGALATAGLLLELFGVIITQVARIYMGRSFGILPANRGIVSNGPFRHVRHPIYFGWLILSIGYAMSYLSWRNVFLIAATLPFMVWRISQEETHLSADPEYRGYMNLVRFRLWPGVI
ncbi:MAG TPA: isoprenylcysteine carboxylmethyltransferase family protein [Patescibacteria group bacterium]|nr:isoprenylcysteine carboxylmethyltransferase family protein [Patescibacteria group bacterium]